MSLTGYYKKATFYPSIVVFIVTIIFSVIENGDYKSEWLTADSVILIAIMTAIIYCLIFYLLSLTIFLNKYDKIKKSSVLHFLSWFLLPVGFMIIVFAHEINFKIKFHEEFGSDFVYVLIINLPFLFGLIWSYLSYKKINYSQRGA